MISSTCRSHCLHVFSLFLGFFKSDSSPLKEAFVTASNTLRENFRFGHTSAVDAVEEFGYEE